LILLSGYLVLKNERLQKKVVKTVTESLSNKVNSNVSLQHIDWSFPNGFILENVYIEDQNKDSLLSIERTKVTLNIWDLLHSKVSFRTIQMQGMKAHIYRNKKEKYNFQFFIDAFQNNDQDTTRIKWSMDVESIAFDDCAVYYHKEGYTAQKNHFDPNDLGIYSLDGYLHVRCFTKDSINVKLHNISFKEKSGLELDGLSTTFISNKESMSFNNFVAKLPNSRLSLNDATFQHDNYEAFKDFVNDVYFNVEIAPSKVSLRDLAAFVPAFQKIDEEINLEGDISGRVSKLLFTGMNVRYGENTSLTGSFMIEGLPKIKETRFDAKINEICTNVNDIKTIANTFSKKEIKLPKMMDNIGRICYTGKAKGDPNNLIVSGSLRSDIGTITNNITIKSSDANHSGFIIKGSVESNSIKLAKLLGEKSGFGDACFKMEVDINKQLSGDLHLDADGIICSLTYKEYTYNDIILKGDFKNKAFNGNITMNDENVKFGFNGFIDFNKEKPTFRFQANVDDAQLYALHLVKTPNTSLSFDVETNFEGFKIDDLEGSFSIDNIVFKKNEKEILINNVSLTAEKSENHIKTINLYSDYINGTLKGQYLFTTLYFNLKQLASQYLPTLIKREDELEKTEKRNNFTFNFEIDNTEPLNDIFKLPFVFTEQSQMSGFYNDNTNKIKVKIESPLITIGKTNMADCTFLIENPRDCVKLLLRGTHLPNNRRRNPYFFSLSSNIKNDSLMADVHFSNAAEETYSGMISLTSIFKSFNEEGLTADILINPSEIILNDTIWKMHKSLIELKPKDVTVNNFYFNHENQNLQINGHTSSSDEDSITVHFSDLHLDYISDILNQKSISFDGVADGDFYIFRLFNNPYYRGGLNVIDAAINDYTIGNLGVTSQWDEDKKCIAFKTTLDSELPDNTIAHSDIFGGVFLGDDSLYIEGKLKDVDLKFLRKYIGSVMSNNTGTVSGLVKAYGHFGSIGLDGIAYVKDMNFDIDFLKTSYSLSDTVYLKPTSIQLVQSPVYDKEGNHGVVNGIVIHNGFKNFKFAVDVACHNLLSLNTREQDNETFFGKAYSNGQVKISGTPNEVNFDLNLKTMPNTKITIPVGTYANAGNNDFITFIDSPDKMSADALRQKRRNRMQIIEENKKSKTKINLDLNIEATNDATVELIMDARQGDMIKGTGNGKLHITYSTKESGMNMYGNYEIYKGEYYFTIQSVISRTFDITEGSLVRWTGSPYNAQIDINAKYGLNASLNEILDDPSLRSSLTPVNCLLNLTGTINRPIIKFDIDLPKSDAEITSRLKSVINTEELMNKNVASLLALGHFYTMDKNNVNSSSELSSVGFSTLSSQLSNWISNINDDVNVGLNYKPSDGITNSKEFDVALSTQLLNDRLSLNGNFGYKDGSAAVANTTNSIVDFDIEYKVTQSGKYRLKAFNRTNNSYFKQAPNTQGVGIIYREDFDSFKGLFNNYYKPIHNWFNLEAKEPEKLNLKNTVKQDSTKRDSTKKK